MPFGFGADHHGCPTNVLEARRGKSISRAQAMKLLAAHEANGEQFNSHFGVHGFYDAEAVYVWLGY